MDQDIFPTRKKDDYFFSLKNALDLAEKNKKQKVPVQRSDQQIFFFSWEVLFRDEPLKRRPRNRRKNPECLFFKAEDENTYPQSGRERRPEEKKEELYYPPKHLRRRCGLPAPERKLPNKTAGKGR